MDGILLNTFLPLAWREAQVDCGDGAPEERDEAEEVLRVLVSHPLLGPETGCRPHGTHLLWAASQGAVDVLQAWIASGKLTRDVAEAQDGWGMTAFAVACAAAAKAASKGTSRPAAAARLLAHAFPGSPSLGVLAGHKTNAQWAREAGLEDVLHAWA